jgi:hypothetical protein
MKEGGLNMYIHLGGDKVIRSRELIAIFDISNDKPSQLPRMLLTHDNQEKKVERIGEEDAKSLVVTESRLYYSPISSATLKKRSKIFIN